MKYPLFVLGLSVALLAGCGSQTVVWHSGPEKIHVVASFYPLAEFSSRVGGDFVEVLNLTPAGVEPHDYEPTLHDIEKVRSAELIVVNGGGFEPWREKLNEELKNSGATVLSMTDALKESVTANDPHMWLDPVLAQKEVTQIEIALSAVDPAHAKEYKINAEAYIKELAALDGEFTAAFKNCSVSDALVSHDAFGYLSRRYHINLSPITGLSPEQEPSLKELGMLAKSAKEKGIRVIFFETLVSPRLAETLAQESGAQTMVLNPLEGLTEDEAKKGENYISIMRTNAKNLKFAYGCSN